MGLGKWLWSLIMPALVIYAYRLIPQDFRGWAGRKVGFKKSTSHLGLARVLAGGGWAALLAAVYESSWD